MKKSIIKFLLILLVISILAPSFTVFSSGTQNDPEENVSKGVTWEDVLAGVASPYDYFGELDPKTVPDAVGMETALSRVHIKRLYEEETGLNDAVFLNPDGSRTLYMFDYPIKYIDEKGKVRDISLEIADSELESVAFESVATDSVTTFSMRASDGINLSGNGTSITMVPIIPQSYTRSAPNANSTVKRIDKKTVAYYYDESTEIEYSLTYTGFKEDIVVNEYTGQTEYEFILYTDGNSLVCEDGSYFVVDEDGAVKATVGDIIIITADNKNNTMGSIRSEVIEENEIYALTVVVDEDYLQDEKTTYPIRIDPTVEISYSNDGAGAILDMTINSLDTSNGYSTSIHVGKRNVYGISRILMRFPGLDLDEMPSAAQITDATVSIRDIMCQSEELIIECCAFTGNVWNEDTIGWTQANGSSYSTDMFYERAISYSEGKLQTAQHRYEFNITTAVKGWKSGLFDQEKGIIFKAADEVENGSTYIYKTFGSYNRSSNQPMLSVTYSTTTTNIYADDTYYVNNWLFGKYLRYVSGTTDTVEGKSGLLANLQDTIKWELRKADNGYLIRSADDTTKYLTAYGTSSSQVAIRTHGEGVVSQLYYWEISAATSGGVLIKNKLNGKYLCLSNESVSLVSSPGAVNSENYTASVWRLASDSFYGNSSYVTMRELPSSFYALNLSLDVCDVKTLATNNIYENVWWANLQDFIITIDNTDIAQLTNDNRIKGVNRGTTYVHVYHKVTGMTSSSIITVSSSFSSTIERLDELYNVALSFESNSYEAALLTMQFIRREEYNEGDWTTVAGSVNLQFVNYISDNYPGLYQYFTIESEEEYCFADPSGQGDIDFRHLCATLNGLLYDSDGFKAAVAGEANVDNLCGWAGDLQTLCIFVLRSTNNSNNYNTIYNATYQLIGHTDSSMSSMSMQDLLADTDAYNVYKLLNNSCSNFIESFTTYYDDYSDARFTRFTNGWTKQHIYICVRKYTTNIFFLGVDWPLLDGYEITNTQADAIAEAFTDYIWEKIENEYD